MKKKLSYRLTAFGHTVRKPIFQQNHQDHLKSFKSFFYERGNCEKKNEHGTLTSVLILSHY